MNGSGVLGSGVVLCCFILDKYSKKVYNIHCSGLFLPAGGGRESSKYFPTE